MQICLCVMTMENKTIALFQEVVGLFAPPLDVKVSQWAEQNRVFSRESSAEPGKWRNNRAPYQVEIMGVVNDSEIESIVVMSCSQVGKNEIINNILGNYKDIDPCPILLIEPTLELAEDYSKRCIAPLVRDTRVLKEKISDSKSRDSNNTILSKNYPSGSLALVGANSAIGLASKPIRIVIADEIDSFPLSAGVEGDPLELAEKRTTTYPNARK
jgi:phage terminase large subunit GpA-like protein